MSGEHPPDATIQLHFVLEVAVPIPNTAVLTKTRSLFAVSPLILLCWEWGLLPQA